MPNEPEENEETAAKPTITIAEKTSSETSADKDTITIAEKNEPKKP